MFDEIEEHFLVAFSLFRDLFFPFIPSSEEDGVQVFRRTSGAI